MLGQTFSHYRILKKLGGGGMGVVFEAEDTRLGRRVALKFLPEELRRDSEILERFQREARAASALNHPHICTVHEVGEADGQVYIVMEHVEGRPLSSLLAEPRPMDTVVRYGIQIADALAHAHDHGVVHRDLKTGNVIVTPEGRVKVLDFGLAKRLPVEDVSEQETRSDDSLTQAGQVVGTLPYLAPESLRGKPADARTDIWALGVVLYELSCGSLPFQGRTGFEVTNAILSESPRALPSSVPAGLRAVIGRCLAKEPGERYPRAGEVRAALEAVQSGSAALPAEPLPMPSRRRVWAAAVAALVVAALATIHGLRGRDRGIESIAVLPFVNQGGDPENEYLSDGIAESVIGSLSRLPNLKMIAFGSVLRYKGRPVDAGLVARELGVAAMVIGRVTPHRDGLLISAELIDTRDGSRLWGDQYEAKPGAFLSVQQEISRRISEQLRSQLSGEEQRRVARRYAGGAEAYELYLKGRYYYNKFTPEGYERSIEFYHRAIEKDTEYAPAYAGLAHVYNSMAFEGLMRPAEAFAKMAEARAKVEELDPTRVHDLLAVTLVGQHWDFPAGLREYEEAIAADPQDVLMMRFHAQVLRVMGRWDEAIEEMKRAREIDPLGVETNQALGATYYWAGRYDEAIEQLKKTLEIDPGLPRVHQLLAEVYARKGMHKEAIGEWQQSFIQAGDEESARALGEDFEAKGYGDVMRSLYLGVLDSLREGATLGYVSPFSFALAYAKLGENDQAFAWLEKAYAERSPWLAYLAADPDFDSLRSDPRFAQFVKRIGLP
jgi:non-specific serine/threonine protein kinase